MMVVMVVMMMVAVVEVVVVVVMVMMMFLLRASHPTLPTPRPAAANALPRDPPQVEINGVQSGS